MCLTVPYGRFSFDGPLTTGPRAVGYFDAIAPGEDALARQLPR